MNNLLYQYLIEEERHRNMLAEADHYRLVKQAKQQKMMMTVMPILFGFLFYRMPSGLVLYWLTNTIIMTAEQTFIVKKTNG